MFNETTDLLFFTTKFVDPGDRSMVIPSGVLISGVLSRLESESFYIVDPTGVRPCQAALSIMHQQRRSWHLRISRDHDLSLPCLITTVAELKLVFSGAVEVESNDPEFPYENDLALMGDAWAGALCRNDAGKFELWAYATKPLPKDPQWEAFCPDWNESLEEADAWRYSLRPI